MKMMLERVIAELENKRIVVLGAGLTGMSCVRFLAKHQLYCHVNDNREKAVNAEEFKQSFPKCELTLGQWNLATIDNADVLIVSPGIDLDKEQLLNNITSHCQVMGDVELFCQITDKPILAVTGSNGKSTVVSLLAHVGEQLGLKVALGGNVGLPVLEQLSNEIDCYVLELSSFQLETLASMNAIAATVLNVSDDHLDRHKTLENYSAIKQKVYQQAQMAVINRDDVASFSTLELPQGIPVNNNNVISFGSDASTTKQFGLVIDNDQYYLAKGEEKLIALKALPLAGLHNALNYLAVLALGQCAGWSINSMIGHLSSFTGLAHRCQRINTTDNIVWINDSKATNVGAALAAIHGLFSTLAENNKLILVAGGDGKGADFSPLKTAIENHVAHVITLGKDGSKIAALSNKSKQVGDIKSAVEQANKLAIAGDIVLLSPACASIDMFKNFAERGQLFTEAVNTLQEAS